VKVLMPMLMQQLKPAIVQGAPEVERDYDAWSAMLALVLRAWAIVELVAIALIYASHFIADELRQLTAFYRGRSDRNSCRSCPGSCRTA
jgi:hypothetical protein